MISAPHVYPPDFDPEEGATFILRRSFRGWCCVWRCTFFEARGRLAALKRLGLAERHETDWILAEGCHLDGMAESAIRASDCRVTP